MYHYSYTTLAEEEEEQDSGEWAAEEEWRRSEQCRECVSTDRDESFLTYRIQTRRSTTRGAGGASDTTQITATPWRSIRRLWEMTGLHGSTI